MPALLKTTQIQEPSSSTVNITLDSSGNVGIGTSSPGYKLDVNGGIRMPNATVFWLNNSSGTAQETLQLYSDNNTYLSTPGALILRTNGITERMRITSSGAISVGSSGTATGTSGQVLTSAGSASPPTWSTISATGALIRAPQILTSGTSYTTPSNCTAIYVEAWGGGGNGGGASGTSQYESAAGGGGAGAYCAKYFTVTGSTAYTYAIGAGGGGNTTFTVGATTITAGGGSTAGSSAASTRTTGGAGGTATNGDINARGASGITGFVAYLGSSQQCQGVGGTGASSAIGGGGLPPVTTGNGGAAVGYASGGAGAYAGSTGFSGGSGTQGIIRIWEFT